jgi:5-formyltetrahydrofolate cyclo-ligase
LNICEYKEPFIKNQFGVLEPKYKNIVQNVDLFIVPGVAFTQTGFRVGRGGGYYDELLQKYPKAIKIGICHDFQILNDLPIEEHDVAMDYVFTNKNYYKSST